MPSLLAMELLRHREPVAGVDRGPAERRGARAEPVATAGGDPAQLRGIPVVGAVGGAMRGTRPDQAVR